MLKDKVVEWTRNYLNSFGGKTKVVIGISGGKDSTIAAAVCVAAVGKERVIGVRLPQGPQHDLDVAKAVCEHLGIKSYEYNIGALQGEFDKLLGQTYGEATETNSVYYSNNPARIRMTILYAIAALEGDCRVVCTCNRSEDYIGYSTKWGDMCGDFAPLSDLTVREVKFLGYQLGIPMEFIEKIPEDGLSGKTDEDNIGFSYNTVDDYLLHGIKPDPETMAKMEHRHAVNLHKYISMPAFKVNKEDE